MEPPETSLQRAEHKRAGLTEMDGLKLGYAYDGVGCVPAKRAKGCFRRFRGFQLPPPQKNKKRENHRRGEAALHPPRLEREAPRPFQPYPPQEPRRAPHRASDEVERAADPHGEAHAREVPQVFRDPEILPWRAPRPPQGGA